MRGHPPWPSDSILNFLVNKSSGYFIYAATVIKFVEDEDSYPVEQLQQILAPVLVPPAMTEENPFAILDQLYCQILSTVPLKYVDKMKQILYVMLDLDLSHSTQIEDVLGLRMGECCHGSTRLRLSRAVFKLLEADRFTTAQDAGCFKELDRIVLSAPLQSNPMSENTPSEFNPGYRAVCDVLFDENPVKVGQIRCPRML
ncbi:hypothetical protein C8F01DRAFT_1088381 [Mycena amicta]|nr:hypothetical protein C8F01DRAFT_1088381 [Mycena amicta]